MLRKYNNGNAEISIFKDGSREIEYQDILTLNYPLNIDIRVSSQCSFGLNPKTNKAFCDFCHESATTNGKECDYSSLQEKLKGLPKGIELAIGANNFTENLWNFLYWAKFEGYLCNLTINQGHLRRDLHTICSAIDHDLIKGLGVSYRSTLKFDIPEQVLNYPNTVFHVIAGIDTIDDILFLPEKGVKKVLILGEKDFGFNQGKVNLTTRNHKEWYWWIAKLFDKFEVVSFDNLALEQLNIKRFFNDKNWETFNQGERSFYINAIDGYFAPSSRSGKKTCWNTVSLQDYFKSL